MRGAWSVRVTSAARHHCAPDWFWDTHKHPFPDLDLWFVFGGSGRIRTPTDDYELVAGACFVLRGGRAFYACHDPGRPLRVFAVHFDILDATGAVVDMESPCLPREYRYVGEIAFLREMLDRVLARMRDGRRNEADRWMRAALDEIAEMDRETPVTGASPGVVRRIGRLCDEIREHPSRTPSIEELAGRMHCTRHHFSRLFKRCRGVSPQEFIVRARIDAAKDLLRDTSQPVGRIAQMLGYRDIYFFSRQFRDKTGHTPSHFRKAVACREGP